MSYLISIGKSNNIDIYYRYHNVALKRRRDASFGGVPTAFFVICKVKIKRFQYIAKIAVKITLSVGIRQKRDKEATSVSW